MSVSYFVRYDIQIADLDGFMRRYREVHVPMVPSNAHLKVTFGLLAVNVNAAVVADVSDVGSEVIVTVGGVRSTVQ